MKGYKGFNKGMVCRGKQYAENTTYEEPEAIVCDKGMHFCKNPMDVLNYYPLINSDGTFNEFAEVEADEDECKTDDNIKYCTKRLKIGAKLKLPKFIDVCVEYLKEVTTQAEDEKEDSGDSAQMASSGDSAQMASSGDSAKMASSGDYAQMASSGDSAKMASSGYSAQMASSGDYAQMASSGDYAQMASSGYSAQMASSGDSAKMASSGYSAQMASSGDYAKMISEGEHAVIMCAGHNSIAKAKRGSWITLSEWRILNGEYIPVMVKTEYVDGGKIKEDVFYRLVNGEFQEVEQC